jgi:hypothetical protein
VPVRTRYASEPGVESGHHGLTFAPPPTPEVFPREFLFDRFGGLRFGDVIPELNLSYRVALAHGDVDSGRPRSGAVVEDFNAVSHMVPVIRYMARVTIENTRTMLRAAASMEAK